MSINRIPTRGLERNLIIDLAPGSISSPSLRLNHTTGEPWDHNVNTGLYSAGINSIGITLGGLKSVVFRKLASNKVTLTIFDGETNTGDFISSLDELGLTVFGDIAVHGNFYARGILKCYNIEFINPLNSNKFYPIITFDNLSQIQNYPSPIEGQVYLLKGITNLNDLYSGLYVWSSTNNNPPDSNYNIILNNNFSTGRYVRLLTNLYIKDSLVVGNNNFSVNNTNINLRNNLIVDSTGVKVINNNFSIENNTNLNLQSSVFTSTNTTITNAFRCKTNKYGLAKIVDESDLDAYINLSEDRGSVLSLSSLDAFIIKRRQQESESINETLNIYIDNNFYTSSLSDRGYSGAWGTIQGMINTGMWTSSTPVTWSNFINRDPSNLYKDYAKIITFNDFLHNLNNEPPEKRFNLNDRNHPNFRVFSSIRDAVRWINVFYGKNYNVTIVLNFAPGIYPCENETFNTNVIINGYSAYNLQFNNLSPFWKISPIVNNSSYNPATAYGSDRLLNGATGLSTGHTIRGYEFRTFEYSPVFYQERFNESSYAAVISSYTAEWNPKHTTIFCYKNAPASLFPETNDLYFNDSMLIFNGGSSQIRRIVFQSPQETLRIRNKNLNTDILITTFSGSRYLRKRFDTSQYDTSFSTITNLQTFAPTTSYMSSSSKSSWEVDTIDYIYRHLISSVKTTTANDWFFENSFIKVNNGSLTISRCVFGPNWSSIRKTAPSGGQSHINPEVRYNVLYGDNIKSSIIHLNNSNLNISFIILRGVEYSTFNNSYTNLVSGAISSDCFIKTEGICYINFQNSSRGVTPIINIADIYGRTAIYNENYIINGASYTGYIKHTHQTCSDSLSTTHENLLNGNFSNTLTNNRNIWRFIGACYGYFIFNHNEVYLSFNSFDEILNFTSVPTFIHGTFGTPLEVATDPSGNWRWRKTMFLYNVIKNKTPYIIKPSLPSSYYNGYDFIVEIGSTLYNTPMNTIFGISNNESFIQNFLLLSSSGYVRSNQRNTLSGSTTLSDTSGSDVLSPFRTTGNNNNHFVRSVTSSPHVYPVKTPLAYFLTLNLHLVFYQNGIWIGAKRYRPIVSINTSPSNDTKTLFHYLAYSLNNETFPPLQFFNDKLDQVFVNISSHKIII